MIRRAHEVADARAASDRADFAARESAFIEREKLHNDEKKLWADKERRWSEDEESGNGYRRESTEGETEA